MGAWKHKCYSGSMQGYCEPFKGKKITLMGLGLLGRGVGDAEFLAGCGAELLVTDKKNEAELADSVERLKKFPNISFHLGGHRLEDFTTCDMVIKAAGVPLKSPEIAAARATGVPVVMSTALFAKMAAEASATVVGITGTRGKSTVSHMIHSSLIRANRRTHLGGNVRGLSTLAMLPEIEEGDIAVLELDSWQLQGFGDLKISPHIAVFTNLMPDHQNYYPSMEAYFADKANIFRYQSRRRRVGTPTEASWKQGDALLVGASIASRVRAANPPVALTVPPFIPADWTLKVIGEHNRENASLAAAVLRVLGLSENDIRTGFESFEPVEGRLQFVREINGVKIYNDNNATTPEATIAALRALDGDITLITGGSEKGLDLKELIVEIKQRISQVVLLVHANYKGSERLAGELRSAGIPFEEASSLQEAVEKGMSERKGKNGTLLFSPAFASFGMFKNEYDRNHQFMREANSL